MRDYTNMQVERGVKMVLADLANKASYERRKRVTPSDIIYELIQKVYPDTTIPREEDTEKAS